MCGFGCGNENRLWILILLCCCGNNKSNSIGNACGC